MSSDPRVELLVAAWVGAREAGNPQSVSDVCATDLALLPEVRAVIQARYGDADETRSRLLSDTDEKPPPRAEGECPLPASIGDYRVVNLLGSGGMGRVYEADDPHLRRRVAVKVMRAELTAIPIARERFLREARAQAAVQHDHVAVIHDVKQTPDGTPFLVMPLLQGQSLAARLAREKGRPLPIPEVVRIGRQMAEGLAAAHAEGLVHRDVKPGNVWLDAADGKVRVLDFGLARAVEERPDDAALTPAGEGSPGTPAYMAPEQAGGRAMDHRADLFALGAVLFEMATGRRAFGGRNIIEVLSAVATHHPPPSRTSNPEVPERLSKLISALLAKEPSARSPDTASGVADYLRSLEETKDPQPRSSTRTWLAAAGGVVAGAAATGGIGWLMDKVRSAVGCAVLVAVLGLLTLLVAVGVIVWAVTRPGGPPSPTTTAVRSTEPAAREPFRGSVDLLVYRVDHTQSDVLVPLSHPLALPLKANDHFKIAAEVNRPGYLYLFWIDETGRTVPVYPWTPGKWDTRPADERPTDKLDLVAPNGKGFKITGEANGMETILMLVRSEKLTATDDEVKGWFAGLKPLPFRGEQARVWFENFDVVREDRQRAFEIDGDVTSHDGPVGLQRAVKIKAGGVEFSRAISFARIGKPDPVHPDHCK